MNPLTSSKEQFDLVLAQMLNQMTIDDQKEGSEEKTQEAQHQLTVAATTSNVVLNQIAGEVANLEAYLNQYNAALTTSEVSLSQPTMAPTTLATAQNQPIEEARVSIAPNNVGNMGTCMKCQAAMDRCICQKKRVTSRELIDYLRTTIPFPVSILRVRNLSSTACYIRIELNKTDPETQIESKYKSTDMLVNPNSYIVYPTTQNSVVVDAFTDRRQLWKERKIDVFTTKLTTLTILNRHTSTFSELPFYDDSDDQII